MENLLQSPFELVRKKPDARKFVAKKRLRKDDIVNIEKVIIKEEYESYEITQTEESEMNRGVVRQVKIKDHPSVHDAREEDLDVSNSGDETSENKGEALTLLDIAMLSVQKLSTVYSGKTTACKKISLDLLKNQYTLTCKEHPAMAEFEKKLNSFCEDISLASPLVFLHHNASFLVDMHEAVEQQIMIFEKEIIQSTGEKLGRDRLPKFSNFVNLSESATSRYIHMVCDILSPRSPKTQNYRKHWLAFCEEKNNPSRLAVNESNQFNNYFEAAAGLVHHHKEVALFFSDLLSLNNDECPNIILESVAADANDSVIQSFVCVLAIVYCKIIGPYWQLLKSNGEYSLYSQYMLCLYQKYLDWSKDPSTLLEPEGTINVFLQLPLQEKTFNGVFHYCGLWHTNRDLIRACLKRMIKVIAAITEENLKDFLPGGKFSQVPSPDLSLQLVDCTFSVLMAEYPCSHEYPYKKRPDESSKRSSQKHLLSGSDSSQDDNSMSGSSDESSDDSSDWHTKKSSHVDQNIVKKEKTGRGLWRRDAYNIKCEENMDREYIIATVNRNGGPCKSQPDVDKMMLRFDGKSRAEKLEAIRCEILYQKMILNNTSLHLDFMSLNSTNMVLKLKLALPRVKPGYSLVLAPRKTKAKSVCKDTANAATVQSEISST